MTLRIAFLLAALCGWASAAPEGEADSRLGNLVRWYLHEPSPVQRESLLASMQRITDGDIDKLAAAIRACAHGKFEKSPVFGKDATVSRFHEDSNGIVSLAGAAGRYALLEVPRDYDPARAYPLAIQLGETRFDFDGLPEKTILVRVYPGRHPQALGYAWATEALVLSLLARTSELVHIDPARVFLMGERHEVRDYAELAFYIGLHNPDRFAGILAARGVWRDGIALAHNSARFDVLAIDSRRGDPVLRDLMKELQRVFPKHVFLKAPRNDRYDATLLPHIHEWWKEGMREPPLAHLTLVNDRPREMRAFWLAMRPKGTGSVRKPLKLGPRTEPVSRGRSERRLSQPARIQATLSARSENGLTVRTSGVTGFDLYVDPEMFDLNLPLKVVVNDGPVQSRVIDPSFETMLDDYQERRDSQLLYVCKLTFTVRD